MTSGLREALEAIVAAPAGRKDPQARERRVMASVLLECALHGCANAKMGDIAKRARVSTATLYRDYEDRDALFSKALELALQLLAQVWRPKTLPEDPLQRLELLLRAHSQSWADPFLGWLIRMYVQFASSKSAYLLEFGRAGRASNMAFWTQEIEGLEARGFLVAGHTQTILYLILGAIERRTIFARLGFGEMDNHEPKIDAVVNHIALAAFQVFGTETFWSSRTDQRAPGWCGDGCLAFSAKVEAQQSVDAFWYVGQPKPLLDLPSQRLAIYAERVLAQDHSRLDVAGRRLRVQLATMLECSDKGYENVGMSEIASRAKVSTATLYADYANKDGLFLDVMKMQARLKVDYGRLIDKGARFQDAIASLNFSIARVLADTKFLWFHYASMSSDLSQDPELIANSRATRADTEGFWIGYFEELMAQSLLPAFNMPLMLNLLLGPPQRRSLQAMVLFGPDDANEAELAHLSRMSVEFFLRLLGPV